MANHHTRAVPEIDYGQREELERWLRRSKTGQALALRARIVLACALDNYGTHKTAMIHKWLLRHPGRHPGITEELLYMQF